MPKVSVIIPVYNTEKYLEKCLESVINQTFEDIEIICINDASTDGSLDILNDYALKDNRIKVINFTENKGVSVARNLGIDYASGEYISFLDPDDWIELDFAEKLYNALMHQEVDIIQFAHNRFDNGDVSQDETKKQINNVNSGVNSDEYFCDFVNFVWDKIYKTTFIKENNIKFPLNIHPTEDVIFALECFSYNPNIIFISESLYNYCINRDGSAMKKYDKLVTNQIEAAYILFNSDFYKNSDDNYKKQCVKKIIGGLLYFCALTISKKYSMAIYISQLRKFVLYMLNEVPEDIINSCEEFKNIERFALLKKRSQI